MTVYRSTSEIEGYPGYPERSGQEVEILRPLTADEIDADTGPMFKVRFADGVETDAFGDELSDDTPTGTER